MVAMDKQAHFWWGWAIAATIYPHGLLIAVLIAAGMGAAKELWDREGHGTPDWLDFISTLGGGIVGALVCYALARVAA